MRQKAKLSEQGKECTSSWAVKEDYASFSTRIQKEKYDFSSKFRSFRGNFAFLKKETYDSSKNLLPGPPWEMHAKKLLSSFLSVNSPQKGKLE